MSGPLRILMVTQARGGAWTSTCLLAGALPIEKFRVTVAVVGPAPDASARQELMQHATHAALAVLEGPLETSPDAWATSGGPRPDGGRPQTGLEQVRAKLDLLCQRLQPDVLHVNQPCLARIGWDGPRVVTAVHDLHAWSRATGKPVPVDATKYRAEVKASLASAQVVVAPSAHVARDLERHYKLTESVRVIRHGAAPAGRTVTDKGLAAVCVGSFDDPAHHLELLLQIAPKLPGPVGIVGELRGRTLPRPLVHLGCLPRRDLLALFGGTKVFVGLSKYDPLAQGVAEAHAAGCRLVLLENATYRELWSGIADLVHDADSLANTLRRAHAAPRLAKPAAPKHSLDQTASAYARLYEELAEERGIRKAAA